MHSSSRSKPIIDRRLEQSQPDVPILETEDLPAHDDWDLRNAFAIDQDGLDDMESDAPQVSIERGDFD